MTRVIYRRDGQSRRHILQLFGAGGLALTVPLAGEALAQPTFGANPFQLGVAAGDPWPDGFVIWTRLAPDPLAYGYGMSHRAVEVDWQVATEAAFTTVVRSGKAVARPELGHSIHVEVAGLEPARPYWYRFTVGAERSATGRAKTAPAAGSPVGRVRIGVAGCQNYEAGYFTALRKLSAEDVDFIYCYGDYIYEGRGAARLTGVEAPARRHYGEEPYSLDDYRIRYAQYKLDPDLQAAHASAAWWSVWDDHETDNNWASRDDQDGTSPEIFALRRQAAAQAYYENTPLRASAMPSGTSIQLYRRAGYGNLVALNFLDTRQFRSHQPCTKGEVPCVLDDPSGTIMGAAQEKWLLDGMSASKARWNVIAQQVMMMDLDRDPGPGYRANTDSWGGYRAQRGRFLGQLLDRKIANTIVLTGDEHINFAGELHVDGRNPGPRPAGIEFVGTSVTSSGDGMDQTPNSKAMIAGNAELKFINNQRGYLICDVTPERWQTEFKVLDKVSERGGVLSTRTTLVVESGSAKIVAA
ncbi:alkaline phosphatase [soil metagenome]